MTHNVFEQIKYPEPQMYRLDPVRGMKFIVPIALEEYDDGYNPSVEDIYEVMTSWHPGPGDGFYLNQWVFKERIRNYVRPLHYDMLTGEPYRCAECEMYWKKTPDRPDVVLLVRSGEHPDFKVESP